MLDLAQQGTFQDTNGNEWVFYQDDLLPSLFYIVPQPQYVMTNGAPTLQVITYATDNPATNGSGYVQVSVELSVPPAIQAGAARVISQQFGISAPTFAAPQYHSGGMAWLTFVHQGTTTEFGAPVSSFGSNEATFVLELDAAGMAIAKTALNTRGGVWQVRYALSVQARFPAVTAVLSFDSSIAYQYNVTQPQHHTWGADTPGSVQALLKASEASTTTITWGTANPPDALVQAVATWANTTLADLVNAEVREQLQIQGMTSSETFDISSVNSFSHTYQQNDVVPWIIQPQVVLPSLADLGLSLATFSGTANEQLQVMTVSVDLPFPGSAPPLGPFAAVNAASAVATVTYPGLPQNQATATFTRNGSKTFTAPFDPAAGPSWTLDWVVTYVDGAQVPGSATTDQGRYVVSPAEAGILTVTFEASQAFNTAMPDTPSSVAVALRFTDPSGKGPFIDQQIVLQPRHPSGSITSLSTLPVTTEYSYTITYNYPNGLTYTAPTKTAQSGFTQTVPFASAVQATPVFLLFPNDTSNPVLGANVSIWYQSATAVQGASGTPTATSPVQFDLLPAATPQGNYSFARDAFDTLVNTASPLVYSASINTIQGQTAIESQVIAAGFPSLQISPTQRYFTLAVVPDAIDWKTAKFTSVQVEVTAKVAGVFQPTPAITFAKGETDTKYLTLPYDASDAPKVVYSWEASYITPGAAIAKTGGKGLTVSDVLLDVPANA